MHLYLIIGPAVCNVWVFFFWGYSKPLHDCTKQCQKSGPIHNPVWTKLRDRHPNFSLLLLLMYICLLFHFFKVFQFISALLIVYLRWSEALNELFILNLLIKFNRF